MSLFMQDKFRSAVNRLFENVQEESKQEVLQVIQRIVRENKGLIGDEVGEVAAAGFIEYIAGSNIEDFDGVIVAVNGWKDSLPEDVQGLLTASSDECKYEVEKVGSRRMPPAPPALPARGSSRSSRRSSAEIDPGGAGGGEVGISAVGGGVDQRGHVSRVMRSSSSHSSEMPEGVIDELRINALKAEIIDEAIAKFKLRKTDIVPFSQTYDLRGDKGDDEITYGQAKSGMRNKIYAQLMGKLEAEAGLIKEYLEDDKDNLIGMIDEFILSQASSLTPKQTSCSEKNLKSFFNDVIAVRHGIYSVPEMRGLLEKDLSFDKIKRVYEDLSAVIREFPEEYRQENGGIIAGSVNKITEKTPKDAIKQEILAHFHTNIPVLKDLRKDIRLNVAEAQLMRDKMVDFIYNHDHEGGALRDEGVKARVVASINSIMDKRKEGGAELNPEHVHELYEAMQSQVYQHLSPILKRLATEDTDHKGTLWVKYDGRGVVEIHAKEVNKIVSIIGPEIIECAKIINDDEKLREVAAMIADKVTEGIRGKGALSAARALSVGSTATIGTKALEKIAADVREFYKRSPEYHHRIGADRVINAFEVMMNSGAAIKADFSIGTDKGLGYQMVKGLKSAGILTTHRSDAAVVFDKDVNYKELNQHPAATLSRLLGDYNHDRNDGEVKTKLTESILRFVNNVKDLPVSQVFSAGTHAANEALKGLKTACGVEAGKSMGR